MFDQIFGYIKKDIDASLQRNDAWNGEWWDRDNGITPTVLKHLITCMVDGTEVFRTKSQWDA